MRSFADYNKIGLRNSLNNLNVREGFNSNFNILRYDLLEAVKPPMLQIENVIESNRYNQVCKKDSEYTRFFIEDLISHCKNTFFDTLIEDVNAPVDSLDLLKNDLLNKTKEMIRGLKQKVAQALAGSPAASNSDDDTEEPSAAGSTATSSNTASPMTGAKGSPSGPSGSTSTSSGASSGSTQTHHAKPSGAPMNPVPSGPSSPTGKASWNQPTTAFAGRRDLAKPNADGFQPAPYGSLRPSDGFWAGLKRLGKAYVQRPLNWLTRGIRNAWHGHDANNVRTMNKEHAESLEALLLEDAQLALKVIDEFEVEILDFINTQIVRIAKLLEKNPSMAKTMAPPPLPDQNKTGAINPSTGEPERIPVTARDGAGAESGATQAIPVSNAADIGAKVAAGQVAPPAEAGDTENPQEEKAVELKNRKAALEGAKLLGLQVNNTGKSGGWGKVTPQDIVFSDGGKVDSWAGIRNKLYEIIWKQIEESPEGQQMINAYKDTKRHTPHPTVQGKHQRGTVGRKDRRTMIFQWLNIDPNLTGSRSVMMEILANYYRKTNNIPHIAKPASPTAEPASTAVPSDVKSDLPAEPTTAARSLAPPPALSTPAPAGRIPVTARDTREPVESPVNKAGDVKSMAEEMKTKYPDQWEWMLHSKFKGNLSSVYKVLKQFSDNEMSIDDLADVLKGQMAEAPAPAPAPAPAAHKPIQPRMPAKPLNEPKQSPAPAVDKVSAFKKLLDTEKNDPANKDFAELLDSNVLDDAEIAALVGNTDVADPNAGQDLLKKFIAKVQDKLGSEEEPAQPVIDKLKGVDSTPVVAPVTPKPPMAKPNPMDLKKKAEELRANAKAKATSPITAGEGDPEEQLKGPEGENYLNGSRIFKTLLGNYEKFLNSISDNPENSSKEVARIGDVVLDKVHDGEMNVGDALNYLRDFIKSQKAEADNVDNVVFNNTRGGEETTKDRRDNSGTDIGDLAAGADRMRRESFSEILGRFKKLIRG